MTGWSIAGSKLVISAAAASFSTVAQAAGHRTPVVNGQSYQLSLVVTAVPITGRLRLLVPSGLDTGTPIDESALALGTYTTTVTATVTGDINLQFHKVGTALEAELDEVTLTPI